MFIVIYGGLVEGFSFYGPFDTKDAADQWAKSVEFVDPNAYEIVKLSSP